MRFRWAGTIVCVACLAFSQDQAGRKLCDAGSVAAVDHSFGVIVKRVTLSGKWGSNDATVYLPDKEIANGAVVFSHSTIQADDSSVNLMPFALALAQAGAAVIVPTRSLDWPPRDQSANREGAVVICAEHWLVDHTKVFNEGKPTLNEENVVIREGYAYVGPRLCDPGVPSHCKLTTPFVLDDCTAMNRYCPYTVWVPVGETEGGDNTVQILSDHGLNSATWLQRHLGLAPIKPWVDGPMW